MQLLAEYKPVIILGLLLLGLILTFMVWLRWRTMARLLESLQLEIPVEEGEFRATVLVRNDLKSDQRPKLLPKKEAGFLIVKPNEVLLYSINFKGERHVRRFARASLRCEWVGRRFMRDTSLHWFSLYEEGFRILISSYMALDARASRQQTTEIYRQIVGSNASKKRGLFHPLEMNKP